MPFTIVNTIANNIDNLVISNNISVGNQMDAGVLNSSIDKINNYTAVNAGANQVVNLTAEQSGTTILVTLDTGGPNNINFVLPAASIGLQYKFILYGQASGGFGPADGDIMFFPNGYTQSAGISAANAPANTINVFSINLFANSVLSVASAAGNDTGNGNGGIQFQGGFSTGGDNLTLMCVNTAAATAVNDPQWTGYASSAASSALIPT